MHSLWHDFPLRKVYATKAVVSALASIVTFGHVGWAYTHRQQILSDKGNILTKEHDSSTHALFGHYTIKLVTSLTYGLKLMDEVLALILVRELYKCICLMKLRKLSKMRLVKVVVASGLVVVMVSGLHEGILLVDIPRLRLYLITTVTPFHTGISLIVMVSIFYYGFQILVTLVSGN